MFRCSYDILRFVCYLIPIHSHTFRSCPLLPILCLHVHIHLFLYLPLIPCPFLVGHSNQILLTFPFLSLALVLCFLFLILPRLLLPFHDLWHLEIWVSLSVMTVCMSLLDWQCGRPHVLVIGRCAHLVTSCCMIVSLPTLHHLGERAFNKQNKWQNSSDTPAREESRTMRQFNQVVFLRDSSPRQSKSFLWLQSCRWIPHKFLSSDTVSASRLFQVPPIMTSPHVTSLAFCKDATDNSPVHGCWLRYLANLRRQAVNVAGNSFVGLGISRIPRSSHVGLSSPDHLSRCYR